MVNKVFISILLACIAIFLGGLYSLLSHLFIFDGTIAATIFGGVLSMFGGAFGAFGAYFVAKYQMDKEKEQYLEREKIKSRPIVYCNEFQAPAKLGDTKISKNARILSTTFYEDNNESIRFLNFYELKILGNIVGAFDCRVKVFMKDVHKEHAFIEAYLGLMENNTEVFIPLPFVEEEDGYVSYPKKVELQLETFEGEKIRYEYNPQENKEKYFLINDRNENLYKEFNLSGSRWILPGKKN